MSDPESITPGRMFPQWMRTKSEKYDVSMLPNSPPPHDDSFFYIRYPITNNSTMTDNQMNALETSEKTITNALSSIGFDKNQQSSSESTMSGVVASPSSSSKFKNEFSKHTEPCKKFLTESGSESVAPPFIVSKTTKPFGIDDGFKGAGAACGSSIVKVAQQMVSGKSFTRGFTVANFNNTIEITKDQLSAECDDQIDDQFPLNSSTTNRLNIRRGSKSLPASPMGSPKSIRKNVPNPYFTNHNVVTSTSNHNNNNNNNNTGGGSWLFSSLSWGLQREQTNKSSTSIASYISEENEDTIVERISAPSPPGGLPPSSSSQTVQQKQNSKIKPSELREMNFWSPTSM